MTTVNTIQGNINATVSQNSNGFLDRLLDWMNNALDSYFGLATGDAVHDNPAEAYLFLNPSCGGGIIDTGLWDLLTDRRPQPETEEDNNV